MEELCSEGYEISRAELEHVTPTMTEHIDLIGKFEINLSRTVLFKFTTEETERPQC